MLTRILAIFAIPAVLVFVVFAALGFVWWPFWLFALPAAIGVAWWLAQRADRAVLARLGARPIAQREGERILNTLENLCLHSGITQPEVLVLDTDAVNLAAVSGKNDSLLVTTGLLELLDVLEMEGVVAHALTKLSSRSTHYEVLAASIGGLVTTKQRAMAKTWGTGDAGVLAFDISGVGLTRYPPGLRSALEKIDGRSTDIDGASELGAAWLVPPTAQRVPLEHRIEVLWEL